MDPQSKAMSNHLILKMILENLSPLQLLQCRRVTPAWNEIIISILLDKKSLSISISYLQDSGNWSLDGRETDHPLKDLNELLYYRSTKWSWRFPCSCFKITGNLGSLDFQEFVYIYGKNIKELEIRPDDDCSVQDLRNLLLYQVPQLQVLKMDLKWWGSREEDEKMLLPFPCILPNLRGIETIEDRTDVFASLPLPLIKELVSSSPNLQWLSLSFLDREIMDWLLLENKLYLIHKLRCQPTFQGIPSMEKFISLKPAIKTLQWSMDSLYREELDRPYFMAIVRHLFPRLLDNCKNTLTTLQIELIEAQYCFGSWPSLNKVKNLELGVNFFDDGGPYPLKPKPVKLNQMFPHVEKVRMRGRALQCGILISEELEFLEKNFPFDGPCESVKFLEIWSSFLTPWMEPDKLPLVFGNLSHLSLREIGDFRHVAKLVWRLQTLTHLDLEIDLVTVAKESLPLDSIFTGLEPEFCANLRKEKTDLFSLEVIENFRVNSSALDLKGLKKICIKILFAGINLDGLPYQIITPISALYAFNLMPGLEKVTLEIGTGKEETLHTNTASLAMLKKIEDFLIPMHPFINIVFKNRCTREVIT